MVSPLDPTPWYETATFMTAMSALIASVVSVSLTGYSNARIKKIEYINLYYVKLIEKRLAAYDQLEGAINYFRNSVSDETDNFRPVSANMFDGYKSFQVGFDLWIKVLEQLHWYSEETASEIDAILKLLEQFMLDVTASPQNQWDRLTKERGKDINRELMICHSKIFSSMTNDYFNLHNIDRFRTSGLMGLVKWFQKKPNNQIQPRVISEQLLKQQMLQARRGDHS